MFCNTRKALLVLKYIFAKQLNVEILCKLPTLKKLYYKSCIKSDEHNQRPQKVSVS